MQPPSPMCQKYCLLRLRNLYIRTPRAVAIGQRKGEFFGLIPSPRPYASARIAVDGCGTWKVERTCGSVLCVSLVENSQRGLSTTSSLAPRRVSSQRRLPRTLPARVGSTQQPADIARPVPCLRNACHLLISTHARSEPSRSKFPRGGPYMIHSSVVLARLFPTIGVHPD
jgi:hypothetical protein